MTSLRSVSGNVPFRMNIFRPKGGVTRATSNICTNQALAGLVATVYLASMGEQGIREVAAQCYHKAHYAFDRLSHLMGLEPVFDGPFFHEFALRLSRPVDEINRELLSEGIVGPYELGRHYDFLDGAGLFCVTEMNSRSTIDRLVSELEVRL